MSNQMLFCKNEPKYYTNEHFGGVNALDRKYNSRDELTTTNPFRDWNYETILVVL